MKPRAADIIVAPILSVGLTLSGCSAGDVTLQSPSPIIAGDYSGTAQDSLLGASTASTTLTEQGSRISGTIAFAAAHASIDQAVTWTVSNTGALDGFATGSTGGAAACTFRSTGTYNTATAVITGAYVSTNGCTGETGTFTLVQECTRPATPGTGTSAADARRRPERRPTLC